MIRIQLITNDYD